MKRRELMLTAMGAALLPGAFGQHRTTRDHRDPVWAQLVREQVRAVKDLQKNRSRLTPDIAKRISSLERTLAVYGRTIQFDERLQKGVVGWVRERGRDAVLDLDMHPDHVASELAPFGLDLADELRQIPFITHDQKDRILTDALEHPDFWSRHLTGLADGLDHLAEIGMDRLGQIPSPQAPVRPVQFYSWPCMDCSFFTAQISFAVSYAVWICNLPAGVLGADACAFSWANVFAWLSALGGCYLLNQGCRPWNRI